MRSSSNSITYPLADGGWIYVAMGCCIVFFVSTPCIVAMFSDKIWNPIMLVFTVATLWPAACCFVKGLAKIHFVPEGIAISLFGRTFRTYPIEQIKMILVLEKDSINQEKPTLLCVSCVSQEELAKRREGQLRRNPYMRSNVPFRKRTGNWEKTFAMEYLRKKISIAPWSIPGRELLYMEYTWERNAFLKQMYPDIPYEQIVRKQIYSPVKPILKNPPPDLRCHTVGEAPPLCIFLISIVPSWLFLMVPIVFGLSERVLFPSLLALIWLFGSLLAMLPMDWQRISFLPEGILLRLFGVKMRLLPAEQIRTIACFDFGARSAACRYLSATYLTIQQIRELEEKRMSRSKKGREILEADRLTDGWDTIVIERYFNRRMTFWGYMDWEQLLIAHSEEREQLCRELYPQAVWYAVKGKKINPDDVY